VFITTLPCNPSNPKLDYGNAILSPHPMKEYGNYLISTPGVEQRRGELSRIASASVLLPSGRWVRVFNSHLTANPKGNESEHQRELNKQVADVIWVINIDEFFVFHGTRSVFMTDFNTTEGTDAYDHMVNGARGGHFDDAWRKFYPAGTGRTTPALTTHLRFDHIFFDRVSGMRVAGAEVLDICGSAAGSPLKKPNDCISDHRPVVTTLVF
jgi:endonuclease/exonuclease/phosphatase family metal-dependent hydrolase